MHAGVGGKGVLFREVSSVQECSSKGFHPRSTQIYYTCINVRLPNHSLASHTLTHERGSGQAAIVELC